MPTGTTSTRLLSERAPENPITVLSISPLESDHIFLQEVFGHSNWRVHGVRSGREALAWLRQQASPVILCEETLPDGDWKGMLRELAKLRDRPELIVTSRVADDSLWAEVLNLGAYDLLMKPFDLTEVFRVVSLAWRHWKNDCERMHAMLPEAARGAA
jgi:DNA-binding response OmpR family regulator